MTSEPLSILLDVTRLISRTGRGPFTGIDRVEFAYLRGLLSRDIALSGFARTAAGYAFLDRAGLGAVLSRIAGDCAWGAPDVLGSLSRKLSLPRRQAEADLRRFAIAHCLRPGLPRMLRRHVASGTWYLNVGHSNLSDPVLRAIVAAKAGVAVMVHDTIPLDFPDHHRPEMVESFARRMDSVARHAQLILSPSSDTVVRFRSHCPRAACPIVVPPGVEVPGPDSHALTIALNPRPPYFVALGTIDPRKNQAFLLDLWDQLGADSPHLYLVGSRGWCPPDLRARLEHLPKCVHEINGLGDQAVACLVAGAAGLLHPSLAEGYGLPLLEAAALGVPVVAADLDVYHETLGDGGVYLSLGDRYRWLETIRTLAAEHREGEQRPGRWQAGPTWYAHLNTVLTLL